MNTSQAGVDLIKRFESCRLKAYPDPKTGGAPYTCGWGETEGVTEDTWWTQDECDRRLMTAIAARELMVSRYTVMTFYFRWQHLKLERERGPVAENNDVV